MLVLPRFLVLSPATTVVGARHPLLACASLALAGALAVLSSACGTECSAVAQRNGCSDSSHYLWCNGGEGYYSDVEEACPADAPFCVEGNTTPPCVTADRKDCLVPYPELYGASVIQARDLNRDGLGDVVYQYGDELVTLLRNSSGDFEAVPIVASGARSFALADLTQDGAPDLAVLKADEALVLEPGLPDGSFDFAAEQPLFQGARAILGVTRFDQDEEDDVLLLDSEQRVVALLSASAFEPTELVLAPRPARVERVAALDTDQDGSVELLVQTDDSRVDVYQLDVDLWTTTQVLQGALVAVADLDGDANRDLILNDGSDSVYVEISLGDGSFGARPGLAGQAVLASDLNGDERLDLVVQRERSLVRLDGLGDGNFQDAAALNLRCRIEAGAAVASDAGTELVFSGDCGPLQRLKAECLGRP